MTRAELDFDRPAELSAVSPPEMRGVERDRVRLMVSDAAGDSHHRFFDLARILREGDLMIVNESATVPASLSAHASFGTFLANVSTDFGGGLWLIEPRRGYGRPGPVPIVPGEFIDLGGARGRLIGPYPGIPRLWFVAVEGDLRKSMACSGLPIRYGYSAAPLPLEAYQTVFSRVPGSAEMASAGRPFTPRLLHALERSGVRVASIVLHSGVSSLEMEAEDPENHVVYPEPFEVPSRTAAAYRETRRRGGRVIAVGTTVVRALETAWNGRDIDPMRGSTRVFVRPRRPARSIDGLLTGLHEPRTSHLALLHGFVGPDRTRRAYAEAVRARYLWHEFGDSHLLWAS